MISLQIVRPHWVGDDGDDPEDYCAHGHVELVVNGEIFVDENSWPSCTLSAAGLFLLRTIEQDHLPDKRVTDGNYLFPCCGFSVWPIGDNGKLVILGCPNGFDVWVRQRSDLEIELALDQKIAVVSHAEWTKAVVHFSDQIKSFYARSLPKVDIEDDLDRRGWAMFWSEWNGLVGKHRSLV